MASSLSAYDARVCAASATALALAAASLAEDLDEVPLELTVEAFPDLLGLSSITYLDACCSLAS